VMPRRHAYATRLSMPPRVAYSIHALRQRYAADCLFAASAVVASRRFAHAAAACRCLIRRCCRCHVIDATCCRHAAYTPAAMLLFCFTLRARAAGHDAALCRRRQREPAAPLRLLFALRAMMSATRMRHAGGALPRAQYRRYMKISVDAMAGCCAATRATRQLAPRFAFTRAMPARRFAAVAA